MRIAQMLDTFYMGGAQMMQLFLVESLQPLGINIAVICLKEHTNSKFELRLQKAGAQVIYFPFPKLFSPRSFSNLVRFLRQEKFDLLHSYLAYSNIIGSLAGKLTGIPTIASVRSTDYHGIGYSPQRAFLETVALKYLSDRVMANGLAVANYTCNRLNDSRPVDTIPNAVDLVPPISVAERQKLRKEILVDKNSLFILSVGRLTVAKGYHDLIDAMWLVHEKFPSAILAIAGDGDLLNELSAHIAQLGLEGTILLLMERKDVPHLLAAADIYVNSSHWEGTPVSVLEAMAAGLPVVATAVGESPYLLAQNVGLLVPDHSPAELADALLSLLASQEERQKFGELARKRIEQSYTRDAWMRSLLNLYSELTPKAKPYLSSVIQRSNYQKD